MLASVVGGDAMDVVSFPKDCGDEAVFQCSNLAGNWNVMAARGMQ